MRHRKLAGWLAVLSLLVAAATFSGTGNGIHTAQMMLDVEPEPLSSIAESRLDSAWRYLWISAGAFLVFLLSGASYLRSLTRER